MFFSTDQLNIFLRKLVKYRCVLWIHSHASTQVSSVSTVSRLQAGGQRNRGWIPCGDKTFFCCPKRAAWPWEEVVWSRYRLFIFQPSLRFCGTVCLYNAPSHKFILHLLFPFSSFATYHPLIILPSEAIYSGYSTSLKKNIALWFPNCVPRITRDLWPVSRESVDTFL
jgi:hypothetical protein